MTPSFLATPEYQGSASRCKNKRKAPRLPEGFRLASTSIALGTRIKNHRSQTQCPGLQASMPRAAPADPGLMVWGGEDSPPLMGMGGRAEIPPLPCSRCTPVVSLEITDRDRLGLICQQCMLDLEQKYWSEGGGRPYLKNRLG